MIQKLQGRRVCSLCHKSYNLCAILRDGYDMPAMLPVSEGICDSCQVPLVAREDDKRHVITKRLQEYYSTSHVLLECFHKDQVPLVRFSPKRGTADYPQLSEMVKPYLE